MENVTLIATLTFGLEAVVKYEILNLGFPKEEVKVSDGKVEFEATLADIPRANLWLRSADRVLVKIGQFEATTFDDLFEQTKALPWEAWIPANGSFPVIGKAHKSQLGSVRACQAIVKKAIVDRLMTAHQVTELPEDGEQYTVQIAMRKDIATLTLDSSGSGLHKRGYRTAAGEAPLKETMAAGLVQLSFWNKDRYLVDPFCGAGTILIEAAMLGRNIAPGLNRSFAAESWPTVPQSAWDEARQEARDAIDTSSSLQMHGYDIDPEALPIAQQNAINAGVGDDIIFERKDVKDLWIDRQHGIVITNPPYGQRLAEFQALNQIYISLHKTFRKKFGWSVYVLSADRKFPDYFKRARPDRVRKLYNGTIEVNYYQYYGEKPS
ncbi:MAG: class I SAM-dependent RNA methyltransferase [Chloroflexota bacterium]